MDSAPANGSAAAQRSGLPLHNKTHAPPAHMDAPCVTLTLRGTTAGHCASHELFRSRGRTLPSRECLFVIIAACCEKHG